MNVQGVVLSSDIDASPRKAEECRYAETGPGADEGEIRQAEPEEADGESQDDRESGQRAVLRRELFTLARVLFPALVLAPAEAGGDGGERFKYGDSDCDGGERGSDEALIESMGVLEEESKAYEKKSG